MAAMPESDPHLSPSDAFTWYMEEDPLLRSTIVAVALLDRTPDWDTLVARIDRASRLAPGFRRKVVEPPLRSGNPRWVTDEIDLGYHVRRMTAPAPGDLASVLERARTLGMAGFDKARPLWEMLLVEGLEGDRSALVMKVHHALTDGVGGMQMALFLFDLERDALPPTDEPGTPDPEHLSDLDLLRDALAHDVDELVGIARRNAVSVLPAMAHAVLHPATTVTGVLRLLGSVGRTVQPVSETLSPVMTGRALSWRYQALDVPINRLKEAAHEAGGTLNDGFLAGITGGLRRYHEHHEMPVDELRLLMPISLRTEADGIGGNKITIMRFAVPIGIADPAERIRRLHDLALEIRQEPSLAHAQTIAAGLNLLPRSYVGGMLKHVDFLASNVPGFRFPIYLCGAEVQRYYALGPTIGAAANFTLISYRDTACVGLNSDTAAVPDGDAFVRCLAEGFDEVLDLAGHHAPVMPGGPTLT